MQSFNFSLPLRQPRATRANDAESGYVLLAVIFLAVILLISLAIAAPRMAKSIQRDKELETIHRGEQYKRALKLYYTQFGRYPTSFDQLLNTNDVRFLRKKYTDPLTGKDDWKPVLFGQAHVRPLGFFGQPLAGVAGVGTTTSSMYAAATSTITDANGVPIAGGDNSASGSNGSAGSSSGPSFGGLTNSQMNGMTASASPTSPTSGSPSTGFGSSPSTGFGSSPGSGTSATTFGGGGPIVGVTLPVDKPSLIDYKQQTRYNKWEFNYDPMEDQAQAAAGLTNGASTGGVPATNNPFGANSPNGGTGNGTGFGPSSGSGNGTGAGTGSSSPSSSPNSPQ